MKHNLIAGAGVIGSVLSAWAGIDYSSGTLNLAIPDTGQLSSSAITVANNANLVDTVTLSLNFSGGCNSDLYGYLVYDNTTVVLLNRIGITAANPYAGNTDAGMTVTLSDAALNNIHSAANETLSGISWRPDGRPISPLSGGMTFDNTTPSQTLSAFHNLNPNGTWTLYYGDMSSGAQSTLVSWGLNISGATPVPEPITWALMIFGGVFGGVQVARRFVVRKSEWD